MLVVVTVVMVLIYLAVSTLAFASETSESF